MRVAPHAGGRWGVGWTASELHGEWMWPGGGGLSLRLRQFLQVVQLTGHCARLHWETGTGWLPLAPGGLSLHYIFPRKVFVITGDQLPSHLNHTML